MSDSIKDLEIAAALLNAQSEVRTSKEVRENEQLEQANRAFEERRRKSAERAVDAERRKQNPMTVSDRQKAMSLLKRLNRN